MQEKKEDYYVDTWEKANKQVVDAQRSIDRGVSWVSAGAIVLSVNLFFNFEGKLQLEFFVILAWCFLIGSMIASLWAYIISEKSNEKVLQNLKNWQKNNYHPRSFDPNDHEGGRKIDRMNNVIRALFLLGLFFLTFFSVVNFHRNNLNKIDEKIDFVKNEYCDEGVKTIKSS